MGWRNAEFAEFGSAVVAVDGDAADRAHRRAMDYASDVHYGLNTAIFPHAERVDVEELGSDVQHWLSERISGNLLLVFGRSEVYRTSSTCFLSNWQDMLCPSRDDAVILATDGSFVLFYCHEDEFEFAGVESTRASDEDSSR